MTDKEKDELVAKFISTKKGRAKILQIAEDTGTVDKLGQAIIESINNIAK